MKRKDIESAFSELDLEEASSLLESLTDIHNTKKSARVAELEAEIARLRGTSAATKKQGGGAGKRASPAATHRGPSNDTWSSRGNQPKWLTALVEQGYKVDDFRIDLKSGKTPYETGKTKNAGGS